MVKNIIIAVLVIISLSTTVYAIYQQTEAKRQEGLAVANAQQAETIMRVAEQAQAEAATHMAAAAAAKAKPLLVFFTNKVMVLRTKDSGLTTID